MSIFLYNRKILIVQYVVAFFCIFQINAFLFVNRKFYKRCSSKFMSDEIYNTNQIQKKNLLNVAKAFTWSASLSSVFVFKPKLSQASDITIFPECSESIVVLKKGATEAIVIGTAHISDESAKLVQRTIHNVSPNIVMIELDAKRIGKFSKNSSFSDFFMLPSASLAIETVDNSNTMLVTPSREFNLFTSVVKQIQSTFSSIFQTVSGLALGTILSQFYKSVEKLGFNTGAEFKVAIEESRRLGIKVLLGDRDVDVTLQRLSNAISAYPSETFDRLLTKLESSETFTTPGMKNELLTAKGRNTLPLSSTTPATPTYGGMDKENLSYFVESLKQRRTLKALASSLKEEVPLVYEALIGERDMFMAKAVAEALSKDTSKDSRLVAVVGMMHLDGIQNTLMTQFGYKLVNNPTCSTTANSNGGGSSGGSVGSSNKQSSSSLSGYDMYDLPIIS